MSATGYAGGDPNKVAKAGDTMTGPLTLSADPVAALQAATKEYVDADASSAAAAAQTTAETFATNAVAGETTRAEGAEALLAPLAIARDPRENYLLGWTAPPEYMSADNPPTPGELYLQRIVVPAAGSITKVYAFVVNAGSGMTAGENWVGLYDSNGNRLATSADVSAVWTATHVAQIAVPSTPVTPGSPIYVAALFNGTTMPSLAGGGQQYWDLPNIGAGVPNWGSPTPPYTQAPNHWRYMSYSDSLTALPATVALSSASPDKAFWFGVA